MIIWVTQERMMMSFFIVPPSAIKNDVIMRSWITIYIYTLLNYIYALRTHAANTLLTAQHADTHFHFFSQFIMTKLPIAELVATVKIKSFVPLH